MAQSTIEYPKRDVVELSEEVPILVLHVDDEPSFLRAAKRILEMQGIFQADSAFSVEEAMEKMKKKAYDAIICDCVMPGKDGLQFLKELRASGNKIPFIIFTGKGREEIATKAVNLGADRYFNKIGDPQTVYSELSHGVRQAVEKRKAEEASRKSENLYRNLFEYAGDPIIIFDMKGNITSANRAVEEYGFMRDEMNGKNITKFVPKKYWPRLLKDLAKLSRGETVESEIEIKTPKGNMVTEYRSNPIRQGEKVVGIQTIVRNITERKKTEEMLRESENYLETILNSIFSGVVVIDEETHEIVDANPKALETMGAPREHVIGKVCHRFICPAEKGKCPISDLGQTVDKSERVLLRADGERIPILKTVITTNWKGHKYLIESLIDITERKKTEEALRESEAKYRNLFENSIDVTLTTDLKGTITSINKAAKGYGFKKEDIIGENQLKYVPKKYWPRLLQELVQVARGKAVEGEIEVNTPKGKKIADYRSTPILIGNKVVGVQVVLRDITERKMTEIELEKSEKRFKTLMEEAPIVICNTDLKGKITYVNRRFEEVTGYSRKKIVGMSGWKFVSDETSKLLMRRMKERLMGKPSRLLQGQFKSKDGKWIWVEMESKIIRKFRIPVGFQHIARDITERKRTEKELIETLDRLGVSNEKLSVVGKLTRHDARNKLSTIMMNAFLAKQKLVGDHEAIEYLKKIESASGEVERILDFGRIYEKLGMEELAYMDVAKTLEEAAVLFLDLHGVKVVNDCHGLTVLADSLLRQLLYNMIDNSLKYGEKISQIRVYYEESGKDQLKLIYEDDGIGIPKAEKEKIFKEGYGKGTGYGLYLIRKMCEFYGWSIRETGKQGKGVQFTVTIPRKGESGKLNYKLD